MKSIARGVAVAVGVEVSVGVSVGVVVGVRVGVAVAVAVAVAVGWGVAEGTMRVGTAAVGVGASHAEISALPNDAATSLRKSRRDNIAHAIVT